ncbi:unnamed protein product [Aureobasidium uvarum]|uniref:DNA topoisomerase (ATP-hydrolyzing) n=1 Tax=Aureobasidium uvarum TaxID=2773716 RepID=A0A9N8PW56_9PEZI|nr:unnamed protein product [Aureobasidium uvarum]
MESVNKEQLTISETHPWRVIPSLIDGLVPLQRKVLHTLLQQKSRREIKVDQLAGSVTALFTRNVDHQEIEESIIKLAQSFVGANNINYLEPLGWFGSRRQGGKDAAKGRFIYTKLSDLTCVVFSAQDESILIRRLRKNKPGEPRTYVPALPTILVNGYNASGHDWQTCIPPYNPKDIIQNLRRRVRGNSKSDMQPMKPWFRSWTGQVENVNQTHYSMAGKTERISENVVEVTELPPRLWTQDFKSQLDKLASEPSPTVKTYTEHPATRGVRFVIELEDSHKDATIQRSLEARLGLHKIITTDNLVALDASGQVQKYATDLDILEDFFLSRFRSYERKRYLQFSTMRQDLTKWTDQSRFVKLLLGGDINIAEDRDILVANLIQHGLIPVENYDNIFVTKKRKRDVDCKPTVLGYEHLFDMTVASMMPGPMHELELLITSKKEEIAELEQKSVEDMWEADLDAIEEAWNQQLEFDRTHPHPICKRCRGLGCAP